jgi:hypothetical protein
MERASVVEAQEVRVWMVTVSCEIPCPRAPIALSFWTRHHDHDHSGYADAHGQQSGKDAC